MRFDFDTGSFVEDETPTMLDASQAPLSIAPLDDIMSDDLVPDAPVIEEATIPNTDPNATTLTPTDKGVTGTPSASLPVAQGAVPTAQGLNPANTGNTNPEDPANPARVLPKDTNNTTAQEPIMPVSVDDTMYQGKEPNHLIEPVVGATPANPSTGAQVDQSGRPADTDNRSVNEPVSPIATPPVIDKSMATHNLEGGNDIGQPKNAGNTPPAVDGGVATTAQNTNNTTPVTPVSPVGEAPLANTHQAPIAGASVPVNNVTTHPTNLDPAQNGSVALDKPVVSVAQEGNAPTLDPATPNNGANPATAPVVTDQSPLTNGPLNENKAIENTAPTTETPKLAEEDADNGDPTKAGLIQGMTPNANDKTFTQDGAPAVVQENIGAQWGGGTSPRTIMSQYLDEEEEYENDPTLPNDPFIAQEGNGKKI